MKKSKKNRIAICICAVTFTTFLNAIKASADTNDGIYHISSDLQNVTFETIEDSNGMPIMVDPNVKVTNVNFLCGAHINGGISINSLYSSSFISDAGTLNGNTFINALVTFHDDTKGSDNTFKDTEIAQAYNTSLENTVLINSSLYAQRNTSMMGETFVTSNSQLGLSGVTLENLTVDSTSSVFIDFSARLDTTISKIVNDGYLYIAVTGNNLKPNIINIGDYSGSGIIHMYINLADNQAADLTINQTAAGVKNLVNIKNDGSKDANENSRVNLIKVNSKGSIFSLDTNAVESGGYEFKLFKKANGEGDLYYLATKADKDDATNPTLPEDKPTITTTADAAGNALLSSYLINFSEIQSLSDRLRNANEDNTGAWGKIYAGKFDSFGANALSGFNLDYSAIQLGVDKQFALTEHSNVVHGFSAQYTDGSIDYSRGGDGNIKSYSFAYYLSFFNADNFYNDAIFKFSRMKSNFYVQDTAGMSVSGDAMMNVYSFSNELGKKIYFNQDKTGFNINPFGQVILSKFSSSNYSASNGLNVHLDSRQSVIGKIGSYFSYDVDSNSKLYAKAAYVKEFNKDTQFYLNDSSESLKMNGHWMEYQVGTKFNITDNQEINLSGTFLAGDKFNQKQLSLSYRYSF